MAGGMSYPHVQAWPGSVDGVPASITRARKWSENLLA
jgi:hypothetical protein